MKRLKPNIITPKTRDEVETLVGDITALVIAERKTKALLDKRLKEIKDDYQAQLVDINERVTPLLLRVQAWADAHPEEFGKHRSIQMLHGTVGWRVGQPTLKTLKGWTWDRCLEYLRNHGLGHFIRTKEEPDKQGIITTFFREATREGELKAMGMQIVQDDSFYVEPAVTPDAQVTA